MHRIDGENHDSNQFSSGVAATHQGPTEITDAWLNDVQENLCQAVESEGIALVKGTHTQLRDMIRSAVKKVFTGGAWLVTAQSTPNLTVAVVPLAFAYGGAIVSFAGGNSPAFTSGAGHGAGESRYDLLYLTSAGALAIRAGTAAVSPAKPAFNPDEIPLAYIFIDEAQTTIGSSDITHVAPTLAAPGATAADVGYSPATATDWDDDADPGNVDDALDQLASREATLHRAAAHMAARNWRVFAASDASGWQAVKWVEDLELYVALGPTGTNRVMTSPEAFVWTSQTINASSWQNFDYSPEEGILVAVSGAGSWRAATSADAVTWTDRTGTLAEANAMQDVKWVSRLGLFVAVSSDGTNRVQTSPDGINWTARAAAEANAWVSIDDSPELGLLVAVANTGTNRVQTSPDGINWTARAAAEANSWRRVKWVSRLGLFVAVSSDGTNRVMTSPDGINWTARAAAHAAEWYGLAESPDLGVLVATAITGSYGVMYSLDAINWYSAVAPELNNWVGLCWSSRHKKFVGVSNDGTNRVMHSL